MRWQSTSGFTLLEVLVALVLFAAALLGIIASGQLILARLYESDVRFRVAMQAESVLDSLRSTACARLTSGSSTTGLLSSSWVITDGRDVARVNLTFSIPPIPQRRAARAAVITTLLQCPEP